MSVPFRMLLCSIAAGLLAAAASAPADAALIQTASGNTFVQNGPVAGTLNFAVLDRTGGSGSDPWGFGSTALTGSFTPGTGSNNLNTGAKYLYLYQVTNARDAGILANNVTLQLAGSAGLSSWGYFAGQGLSDSEGLVTATNIAGTVGNDFGTSNRLESQMLAAAQLSGSPFVPSLNLPGVPNLGVNDPGIGGISDGAIPASLDALAQFGVFNAGFGLSSPNNLPPGARSVIFGFTSDKAPIFSNFLLQTPYGPGAGLAPSPVPVPATLLGLASLLPFGGLWMKRRWWPSSKAVTA